MKRIIALLILYGIFSPAVRAQNNIIKGRVLEEGGKKNTPAAYLTITWLPGHTAVLSDSNGYFSLEVSPGHGELLLSGPGYISDTIHYHEAKELLLYIKKSATLKDVVIQGRKDAIYINPLGVEKIEVMTGKELYKAACCNLSESFETSTSVDVSYSDAVTGVKQIQMLGLEGRYTLLTIENQPRMRGLSTNYGLSYIPGAWIASIQLSKGAGTVVNGYESIAGQINVELKKPEDSERLYFNQYGSSMGRSETNLNLSHKLSGKWSTNLLLHADLFDGKVDRNGDHFLDIPINNQLGLVNGWKYSDGKGLESEFGIKLMNEKRYGGQLGFDPVNERGKASDYGVVINTGRYEWYGKMGYVWLKKPHRSMGITTSAITHEQNAWYGLKKYEGREQSFYSNLLYQSNLGKDSHKFKTGFSYLLDVYDETLDSLGFKRKESVPGVFFEYTWAPSTRFTLVSGLRYDIHNLFGSFFTPRLHAKYLINDRLTFRASGGRGQRTANIFAENTSVFVSSRQMRILGTGGAAYGLRPEVAWNYGVNLLYDFNLFYRKGSAGIDVYRTDFESQVVTDREMSPQQVTFYNAKGAYVNSFQLELSYELVKRLMFKTAYRLLDMRSVYLNGSRQQPFVSGKRYFVNLAYETKNKWGLDYTLQWFGPKRIPSTGSNPIAYQLPGYSPSYFLMNAQLSKKWKKLDAYIGCENITGFRQKQLILAANNPFGPYFDASMNWGPVIGRMFYAGLRYKIK